MSLSFLSNETNTETFNKTNPNKLTSSTIVDDENIWNDIKSYFNLQNLLIIISIICIICFVLLFCLVFIVIRLMKKKRSYKKQIQSQFNDRKDIYIPFQTKTSSKPTQIGLTSNQIASCGNIISIDKDSSSIMNSIQNGNKQAWNDTNTNTTSATTRKSLSTNDDDIETVNEVLAMEERQGKMYYKVNFTGHSPDYTAWVCEEDLIPE